MNQKLNIVKAKKPLEINSSDSGLRSSSGDSSAIPSGSANSGSIAGVSEAKIVDLISCQISYLSSSFAASLEASFVQIEALIDSKLSRHVSQDVSNPSFAAPLPVPVHLSLAQGRQDPHCLAPIQGTEILGENQLSRSWTS